MQHVRRFNTTSLTYPIHFRNLEKAHNIFEILPAIFGHAMNKILEGALETDYVGAELSHHEQLHMKIVKVSPPQDGGQHKQ